MTSTPATPFSLHPGRDASGLIPRIAALAAPLIDPILGLSTLDHLYARLPGGNFIDGALERLGITVSVDDEQLNQVPATGPTIVVANHPTGAMDGLVLAQTLRRRRHDVRLLGNHLLTRVPEMREWTIPVNPFDPRSIENRRGVRAARDWLARGGLLVVFPAGAVSNVAGGAVGLVDQSWQAGTVRLARWSDATVVPVFIGARSSAWFRLAGLIHPHLRTALLPRELLRLRNRAVTVRLGSPVGAARLRAIGDDAAQLAYLRARTDALGPSRPAAHDRRQAAIAPPTPVQQLRHDIATLPAQCELLRSGSYVVYCAAADQLPAVLREIGRLRELTFRGAGEGTGRSIDVDRFDRHYQHLFIWHRERDEIVGAYRVGATDRLGASSDVKALYSHTLFSIAPAFLERTGPALELGRSFVRAEYQREPAALFLLWKGIGALIARAPRYRRLFGPVSISADYSAASRWLLARFLATAGDCPEWRRLIRPRRPMCDEPAMEGLAAIARSQMHDVDTCIRELEGGRGVPVLVRHYWKLGAQLLGFSVDPSFGHSLDGLMMVDLTGVPPAVLQRYLGREGAAAFRKHHGLA